MNVNQYSSPHLMQRAGICLSWFTAFAGAVVLFVSAAVGADIPDRSSGRFEGMYKVTSSTDPMFPVTRTREYFLDFGRGITAGKLGGKVAVSVRRNPHVQVRIMAWQYFPKQGKIVLGNSFAEGSGRAVAKAIWEMRMISRGVVFERGEYRVVLSRADPKDY